ncbi:ATP-binding protein [Nonomuraea sp. NPDC050153]|uniref:ATP-binding protein n=1 Tax=Nonomuraea sp. NPDC050153 TaxID=3364359 RepID=UPI0037A14569
MNATDPAHVKPADGPLETPWAVAASVDGPPAQADHLWSASWTLPYDAVSAPVARVLVRAQLADWSAGDVSEVAELLVSELVTDALHHATGPVRLTVWLVDGLLRCEVEGRHPVAPLPRKPLERGEGGYGPRLLDALACCWGSAATPAGKAAWFELPATVR